MSSSKSYGKSSSGASRKVTFFVPGEGIDREVISTDICRYLGNDATARPGEYTDTKTGETTKGFYVTAYRALTTEQLADIKADSMRWAQEKRQPPSRGQTSGDGYRQSATRRQQWNEAAPDAYPPQRDIGRQAPQSASSSRAYEFPQQTSTFGSAFANSGSEYKLAAAYGVNDETSYAPRPAQQAYASGNVARTQPGGYSYTATAQQPAMQQYSYGNTATTGTTGLPSAYSSQQQPHPRDEEMYDYDGDDYQEVSASSGYGRTSSTREPDQPRREERSHRDRDREHRRRH